MDPYNHGQPNVYDDQKFGSGQPQMPPQQPPNIGFVPLVQPHPMAYGGIGGHQPVPGAFSGAGHQQMPNAYPGGYVDPENPLGPEVKGFDFTEQSVRRGFIRKVYGILSCQLLITLAFIALLNLNESARFWMMRNPALLIVSMIVSIVVMIAMVCVQPLRRKVPINFILLAVFTLAESYVVAAITSRYSPGDVFLAVLVTSVVVIGLTMFAFQTKYDFTVCGGTLFVCLMLMMLFGLVACFFPGYIMTMVYSSFGAILFSFYLVYDTQMMMGGDHKYSISPEEYIFGALTLYMDIINLFIYILQLIGSKN